VCSSDLKPVMPMPLFELIDYVGIDIAFHGLEYFARVMSSDYKPSEAMASYIISGNLGKKTGKGFYDWSQGRPKIDLTKACKKWDINHIIALQVNEATKVLEEGIVDDPREIDLAISNGGGSPVGPFAQAQQIGYDVLLMKLDEVFQSFKLDLFKPTQTMKGEKIKI